MESIKRPVQILHKWTIWTILMPYYTNSLEAYLLLSKFSKKSRRELISNFNAFRNSMKNYRKIIELKDEVNVELVEDKLERLKQFPLMLIKIDIPWVYRVSQLEALGEFEEWHAGVEKLDHSFLCTDFEFGKIRVEIGCLLTAINEHKGLYMFKKNSIITDHIHMKYEEIKLIINTNILPINSAYYGYLSVPKGYKGSQQTYNTINQLKIILNAIDTIDYLEELPQTYIEQDMTVKEHNKTRGDLLKECNTKVEKYLIKSNESNILSDLDRLFLSTDLHVNSSISNIFNLEFLNLKNLIIEIQKIDDNYDQDHLEMNNLAVLWHSNDNINISITDRNVIKEDTYDIEFKCVYFLIKNHILERSKICETLSITLSISPSSVVSDSKYFYISNFHSCRVTKLSKKESNERFLFNDINDGLMNPKIDNLVLIFPKSNLFYFKPFGDLIPLLENPTDPNVKDYLKSKYPTFDLYLYNLSVEQCRNICEKAPINRVFELYCLDIQQWSDEETYIDKISIFKDQKVKRLIDSYFGSSYKCMKEDINMIKQTITKYWKDYLVEFQITLESEDMLVPLLDSLLSCSSKLKHLKIQYYVTDFFLKECDELTQWLENNVFFCQNLESFIRIPIEDFY